MVSRQGRGRAAAALLILPGVVDVELSPRHKDRTGAIAGNGEPMLLQIPASIGGLIAGWLLPQLGIAIGGGIIAAIINAFIGAVILLLILRLVRRAA